MKYSDCTVAWLEAIETAAASLHGGARSDDTLSKDLKTIVGLQQQLCSQPNWDAEMQSYPVFSPMLDMKMVTNESSSFSSSNSSGPTSSSNNPFASLQDDDDESDDDENSLPSPTAPTYYPKIQHDGSNLAMSIRRLLIRVLAAKADIYVAKADNCKYSKNWKAGVVFYDLAMAETRSAITEAYNTVFNNHCKLKKHLREELWGDADICDVVAQSIVRNHRNYSQAAENQERMLLAKLEEARLAREAARARMDPNRWSNNPNPKNTHRSRKIAWQNELALVQSALTLLQAQNVELVQTDVAILKTQLVGDDESEEELEAPPGLPEMLFFEMKV